MKMSGIANRTVGAALVIIHRREALVLLPFQMIRAKTRVSQQQAKDRNQVRLV